MEKLTSYDVFIGIFKHFPKGKTAFHADYCDIIDFLDEALEEYTLLNQFTRGEIEGGLSTLIGARMLRWWTSTPHIKEFNPDDISYVYTYYKKEKLFGEKGLAEVKDLSRKFAERFK